MLPAVNCGYRLSQAVNHILFKVCRSVVQQASSLSLEMFAAWVAISHLCCQPDWHEPSLVTVLKSAVSGLVPALSFSSSISNGQHGGLVIYRNSVKVVVSTDESLSFAVSLGSAYFVFLLQMSTASSHAFSMWSRGRGCVNPLMHNACPLLSAHEINTFLHEIALWIFETFLEYFCPREDIYWNVILFITSFISFHLQRCEIRIK
jgi:hypothetical protein